MVELTVRLGPKGQLVIPKIFREAYKIYPMQEAIVKTNEEGILIKRNEENISEKLKKIAEKINIRSPLSAKRIKNLIEQQYEERAKRAGLLS